MNFNKNRIYINHINVLYMYLHCLSVWSFYRTPIMNRQWTIEQQSAINLLIISKTVLLNQNRFNGQRFGKWKWFIELWKGSSCYKFLFFSFFGLTNGTQWLGFKLFRLTRSNSIHSDMVFDNSITVVSKKAVKRCPNKTDKYSNKIRHCSKVLQCEIKSDIFVY